MMRVSRMLDEPHCVTPGEYQADPVPLPTITISEIAASPLAPLSTTRQHGDKLTGRYR